MEHEEIDMSSEAITLRIEKMSQLRDLSLALKKAGKDAGLHNKDECMSLIEKYQAESTNG
ncbi:MAG: hypothetical protein KDK45_19965 [Leptospiraceae bacterium]|nr:hypothetical protein [Leptospiraceae bacterium]